MTYMFYYGPDNQRRKMEYRFDGELQTTTYYALGNFEEIIDETNGLVTKNDYLSSPEGIIAMRQVKNGTTQLYYLLTDHLGSIETVCDESGSIVEQYSYDAWGNRRNPTNWTQPDNRISFITNRGFTGHEHLDDFGLINANARLYEPSTGRFLSPDPFIQAPDYSQNYNRFAYAFNNPLCFYDPDGKFVWFVPVIIGAVAGGYVGGAIQQGHGGVSGANWNPFGGGQGSWDNTAWQGIAVGAIAGAGLGLGVSYGAALAGTHVTAASGASMFTTASSTSFTGWNIVANGLIAGNVNMASRALQGGDWKQTATSGLVGFTSGAIGGAVASNMTTHGGHMSLQGIRTQNYVTSALSGAGDRFFRSMDAELSASETISNTIMGGLEGLTMAWVLNAKGFGIKNKDWIDYMETDLLSKVTISPLDKSTHVFARYASGFLSSAGTSIPGVGFQLGATYYTVVGGIYSGGNVLGGAFSAGLLWAPQTRLASGIIGWTKAWDSYEQIGGFKPFTIW